jgi:hypothetical protein
LETWDIWEPKRQNYFSTETGGDYPDEGSGETLFDRYEKGFLKAQNTAKARSAENGIAILLSSFFGYGNRTGGQSKWILGL